MKEWWGGERGQAWCVCVCVPLVNSLESVFPPLVYVRVFEVERCLEGVVDIREVSHLFSSSGPAAAAAGRLTKCKCEKDDASGESLSFFRGKIGAVVSERAAGWKSALSFHISSAAQKARLSRSPTSSFGPRHTRARYPFIITTTTSVISHHHVNRAST